MNIAKPILFLAVTVLIATNWSANAAEYFTETVDGLEWSYRIENGGAVIESEQPPTDGGVPAVSGDVPSELSIPDRLGGRPVTKIGDAALLEYWNITAVEIPSTVTSIGRFAFATLEELESLELPEGLTDIGERAFEYCGFDEIQIPAAVTNIGLGAFLDCENLAWIEVATGNPAYASDNGLLFSRDRKTIVCIPGTKSGAYTIPSGITYIAPAAFASCYGLTSVKIPDTVTDIGRYAFYGCALSTVDLPASVANIEPGAFVCATDVDVPTLTAVKVDSANPVFASDNGVLFTKDRKTLLCVPDKRSEAYVIPSGVTRIAKCALMWCRDLPAVTIPSTVSDIGPSAFCGCEAITGIVIPDGVRNIGNETFLECMALASVTLPDTVTNIGAWAFDTCIELESLDIPSGVVSIGIEAFRYCPKLTNLTLPASVTSIGWSAFDESGLQTLHVPASWKGSAMLENTGVPEDCSVIYDGSDTPVPPPLSPYAQWLLDKCGKTPETMPEDGDYDGDGASNAVEFTADTDPCDSSDLFKTRLRWEDGALILSPAPSSPNRTYGVMVCTNLSSPGTWQSLGPGYEGLEWSLPLSGANARFGAITVAVPE